MTYWLASRHRAFISIERLHGAGVGSVDVHLLASARLAGATLWTKDKALIREAARLKLLGEGRFA